MKLTDYIECLKSINNKYGEIDVKIETRYETMGENDFEHTYGYTDARKPVYNKKQKCVVVHNDFINFD